MKTLCIRLAWLLTLFCLSPSIGAGTPEYVGSAACKGCHEQQYAAWRASHHYQAMLPATEESVLGDFSDRNFEYGGVKSRFYRKDGGFYVETDNAGGELQEFEITYTFGFYPLQQYLVPFPNGRYQALNIVWDSRPEAQGGQRWIHLYPDDEDPVLHDDIVHWTGSFQNWNSRCAVCHSTGLEKNYSSSRNEYNTTWKEINVACEACHGPASAHLEWVEGDRKQANGGFGFSLRDRGDFGPADGSVPHTLNRLDGARPVTQIETCAACHSRRSELAVYKAGQSFDDGYRLALIESGLYFPDGQVLDEVYVYGSFLQSRMHAAGVVCTNCHDPHNNGLIAEGNNLCSQCHLATEYDQPDHHHHETGSDGAACVNCHMPSRTYMVVDDRRDHSFRVPEPHLSLELGVPNACNQCHQDKDAGWAVESLKAWGYGGKTRSKHAKILSSGWSAQLEALPGLLALAQDPQQPAIVRASALLASQNFPSQESLAALQAALGSTDSLVRESATRSMDWVPVAQRYAMLRDLIADPSKAVRMAVARQLNEFPAGQLPPEYAQEVLSLRKEYLESLQLNADMPEEQMSLGLFYAGTGDPLAAEQAYRSALKLSPSFTPALLNLADLYRANGMDRQAQPLLQEAIEMAPEQASAYHAMGLLLIRGEQLDQAVPYLQKAAVREPENSRYTYVYAVALWESGSREEAVRELESALRRQPGNRELASALASYYEQLGEKEKLEALMKSFRP